MALINWNEIDTVLLDMDGTLLDLHFDNHFWQTHLPKRYAETHGLDQESALAHLHKRFEEEHGSLSWYCLDFWRDELQLDILALKREVSHLIALRPHSAAFLNALKSAGKVVWLVTNAHPDSIALKLEHTPLAQWLDRITSSHSLGAAKETPAFWETLQRLHPFDISRTVFVDDTMSVLEAARAFGIQKLVWITSPDSQKQPSNTAAVNTGHLIAINDFDQILPVARNYKP